MICASLTGCADPVREGPDLRNVYLPRPVPEAAKTPCEKPTVLSTGKSRELKAALARDGIALLECEERRRAAVEGEP